MVGKKKKQLGGPGRIVEIDGAKIIGKRKYRRVFVLFQSKTRTAFTLIRIIQGRIASAGIIYVAIANVSITHSLKKCNSANYAVNHSRHFVNPHDSNVHIRHIEKYFGEICEKQYITIFINITQQNLDPA